MGGVCTVEFILDTQLVIEGRRNVNGQSPMTMRLGGLWWEHGDIKCGASKVGAEASRISAGIVACLLGLEITTDCTALYLLYIPGIYIAVPRAAEDPQLDHCWATPGAAALENT